MSERVELDRLADYAAGLLDDTPDAAEVAHLIAIDDAWAEAYARLVAADTRVRADLVALGAAAEPMPAEVAARLDTALARAADVRPRAGGSVRSLDGARRRRRRWAAALATAAAGVVAFGVFGLPAWRTAAPDTTSAPAAGRGDAMSAESNGGEFQKMAPAGGLLVRVSGLDYRREALRAAEPEPASGAPRGNAADSTAGLGKRDLGPAPPAELARLAEPSALDGCLAAVTAAYGGRPVTVDYARFEGVAALIVWLVDANGRPSRVVVAGAACGRPGSGADVRYTATAG